MRRLALAVALGAALAAGAATAQDLAPDSISAVYSDGMFWSIEDGGAARFRTSERENWRFTVTHEEFVRIRGMVEPLRGGVAPCEANPAGVTVGHVVWRIDGVEQRSPAHWDWSCPDAAQTAQMAAADRAYYAMREWGEARHQPPPALPDPQVMTLTALYWGRTTSEWVVPRGGEGRWSNDAGESKTFPVSEGDFDRLRDIFRPYEGVAFECDRVITDGPYGRLTWSQPGHDDQRLGWDAGCVTGDADDVFRRVGQAETLLKALRDGR